MTNQIVIGIGGKKTAGKDFTANIIKEFLDKKELEIPNYEELPATELNIISYKDALKLGSALLTSKTNLSVFDKSFPSSVLKIILPFFPW